MILCTCELSVHQQTNDLTVALERYEYTSDAWVLWCRDIVGVRVEKHPMKFTLWLAIVCFIVGIALIIVGATSSNCDSYDSYTSYYGRRLLQDCGSEMGTYIGIGVALFIFSISALSSLC